MKTLLLMRHAKAGQAEAGQADFDRSLNQRGQRDAPRMGQWLRQQGLLPDLVISSSARRAAETAAAVIDASGYGGEWQQTRSLYEAGPEAYFDMLQRVPDEAGSVLIVAHNPAIEEMVETLTGQNETLPTGALACLTLPIASWQALTVDVEGSLAQLARPRELE